MGPFYLRAPSPWSGIRGWFAPALTLTLPIRMMHTRIAYLGHGLVDQFLLTPLKAVDVVCSAC